MRHKIVAVSSSVFTSLTYAILYDLQDLGCAGTPIRSQNIPGGAPSCCSPFRSQHSQFTTAFWILILSYDLPLNACKNAPVQNLLMNLSRPSQLFGYIIDFRETCLASIAGSGGYVTWILFTDRPRCSCDLLESSKAHPYAPQSLYFQVSSFRWW